MLFKLRKINLVIGVGNRVVVFQVIPFLLIGNEGGNALQHEVKVVRSPFHVSLQLFDIELSQRRNQNLSDQEHVMPASNREARRLSCTGIIDDHSCSPVQLGTMMEGVGTGAEQSFFFAGEKYEANRSPGRHPGGFDGAQRINHQGGIAAVIESSSSEFP